VIPTVSTPARLRVHLGHQRAGRIDDLQPPAPRLGQHRGRHAVRGEDHDAPRRHLIQLGNHDRAALPELIHHVAVVHDLPAHVNRRAVVPQGLLHDPDRPFHPRAERTRRGEQDAPGPKQGVCAALAVHDSSTRRHPDDTGVAAPAHHDQYARGQATSSHLPSDHGDP
jgi:hypothetical protein